MKIKIEILKVIYFCFFIMSFTFVLHNNNNDYYNHYYDKYYNYISFKAMKQTSLYLLRLNFIFSF